MFYNVHRGVKSMRKRLKQHIVYITFIFVITCLVMIYIGRDVTHIGHDMAFHVTNIENLAKEIDPFRLKFLAPNISQNIGDNLGYGLYIFYPSLPHLIYAYFYKFFSIFHVNILYSIFITNIFFNFISAFLIYFLSYKISQNKMIAFLSSFFFILFPYRLSCIFIRYSINENLALMFVLLILLSLNFLKDYQYKLFYVFFIIGYIGLLSSQLVMALYTTIFLGIYPLFYRKQSFNKRTVLVVLKAVLFVSIIVFPNIISMLEHRHQNYLVFKEGYMTSPTFLSSEALTFSKLVKYNPDGWAVQLYIPIVILILFFISLFYLFKCSKKNRFYLFLLTMGFFSFLFTLKIICWEKMPSSLQMIQFPWRLEMLFLIVICIISPCFLKVLSLRYMNYVFYIIIICVTVTSYSLLHGIANRVYYINGKLDKNFAVGNVREYYPEEYLSKIEYYKNKKNHITFLYGKAKIKEKTSKFPNLTFTVYDRDKYVIAELPRIYYLGYELRVNGNHALVKRSENGFIKVYITENGEYKLTYRGTFLYQITRAIRLILLIISALYFMGRVKKQKFKISEVCL